MKVEINLKQLGEAVAIVSRAVGSRPQLPVLSNILLEAEATGLRLSATDLEIGISTFIPAKVAEVGKTTVPARTFFDYVSALSGEKVLLELDEAKLLIEAGTFKGQIQTIGAEEFPKPSLGGEGFLELPLNTLAQALTRVLFAVAKDSLRPILTGVLFELTKNKLRLVGTDGFRLAMAELAITNPSEEKKTFVLPARAAGEVVKLAKGGSIKLQLVGETKQVVIQTENVVLSAQIMEGNFPDYGKILPKKFVMSLTANREELLQVVRSVAIFARENSNVMRVKVGEGELLAWGEAQERGQAKASCPVAIEEGTSAEVVFNAKYVMDFLGSVAAEDISVGLGEALSPGAFREAGKDDYLYVVMPINA